MNDDEDEEGNDDVELDRKPDSITKKLEQGIGLDFVTIHLFKSVCYGAMGRTCSAVTSTFTRVNLVSLKDDMGLILKAVLWGET